MEQTLETSLSLQVKDLNHLKTLVSKKTGAFAVALNYGVRSSKLIEYHKNIDKFYVTNFIDESEQCLSSAEIMDSQNTIIGEAIEKGALWFEEYVC